jgi:hypothetical protein
LKFWLWSSYCIVRTSRCSGHYSLPRLPRSCDQMQAALPEIDHSVAGKMRVAESFAYAPTIMLLYRLAGALERCARCAVSNTRPAREVRASDSVCCCCCALLRSGRVNLCLVASIRPRISCRKGCFVAYSIAIRLTGGPGKAISRCYTGPLFHPCL